MTPLQWAQTCQVGDSYSYAAEGVPPVTPEELAQIADICINRGMEVFADQDGLRTEKFP